MLTCIRSRLVVSTKLRLNTNESIALQLQSLDTRLMEIKAQLEMHQVADNESELLALVSLGVHYAEAALAWTPLDDDSSRWERMHTLLCWRSRRFLRSRRREDMNGLMEVAGACLDDPRNSQWQLVSTMTQIAEKLVPTGIRAMMHNTEIEYCCAVDLLQGALGQLPADDATPFQRKTRLDAERTLARIMRDRCRVFNNVSSSGSIDDVVNLYDKVLAKLPEDPAVLESLGDSLRLRFEMNGSIHPDDIDRAIQCLERSVSIQNRFNPLVSLGECLMWRFRATADLRDLNRSIELAKEAIEISNSDPDGYKPKAMVQLSKALEWRFDDSHASEDLDWSVNLCAEALALADGAANIMAFRYHLCERLFTRAFHFHEHQSLTRAISELSTALVEIPTEGTSAGFPFEMRRRFSSLLADCYQACDNESEAIIILQKTLEVAPDDYYERGVLFLDLVSPLLDRSSRNGRSQSQIETDLVQALHYAEEACRLIHPKDPLWIISNKALGDCHLIRHEKLKERLGYAGQNVNNDIGLAISHYEKAIIAANSRGGSSSMRAALYNFLSRAHTACMDLSGGKLQWDEVHKHGLEPLLESLALPDCEPLTRLETFHRLVINRCAVGQYIEAAEAWLKALDLIPLISLRSLSLPDQMRVVTDLAKISELATAALIEGSHAEFLGENTTRTIWEPKDKLLDNVLELLEGSRGLIASVLLEARVDLSMQTSEQATVFTSARSNLETLNRSQTLLQNKETMSEWALQSQRCHAAEDELKRVIKGIQAEDQDFLRPPSYLQVLDVLGNDTIVMVNLSIIHCDAILINNGRSARPQGKAPAATLLRLPLLNYNDAIEWAKNLRNSRPLIDLKMLEWLWTSLAKPVLDTLGFAEPRAADCGLPRIIWILSGSLTHMPIHAAGLYQEQPITVLDHVISSYSSTLRAFVLGREAARVPISTKKTALLLGMHQTPDLASLPFAAEEAQKLKTLLSPDEFDVVHLANEKCRKTTVLEYLPQCSIFHFAGHGLSNPLQPANNALVLQDSHLTLQDLLEQKITRSRAPILCVLSACLTGANDRENLAGEGLHMISAFQIIGFRHVIGTLWQVGDQSSTNMIERLYTELVKQGIDDEHICRALHEAVCASRDNWLRKNRDAIKTMSHRGITADDDSGESVNKEKELANEDTARYAEFAELLGEVSYSDIASGKSISSDRGMNTIGEARHAETRKVKSPGTGNLLWAEWVPYVHYGA